MIDNFENQDQEDFERFFNERVRERGLDLKKLSELSGIAVKHLESISSGNFSRMPSDPYFRGYVRRLGRILDFDAELWWGNIKARGFVKTSGVDDEFPRNRFTGRWSVRILWVGGATVMVVLYLVLQFGRILGRPEIIISLPVENPASVSTGELFMSGILENASKLYINEEAISVADDGSWEKNIILERGLNSFEIKAKKFLGGETIVVQQVLYQQDGTGQTPNL